MKTKLIALFCACFMLLTAVDMLVPRSETNIFDNAIRLHILADDNSVDAQNVKLLVRDAILSECADIFVDNGDVYAASKTLEENLDHIQSVSNRVLSENGMNYKAKAQWGYEEYPTRVYEDFTLPSGVYRSLRINLGKGEGNNWWCIMFPPLCSSASCKDFTSAKINKKDSLVFTNRKYIFRLKILELFG